jgi:hypothetical protein
MSQDSEHSTNGKTVESGQKIIDVHTHCFTGRWHAEEVARGLDDLRRAGLRHMVVAGLVNTHLDSEAMWGLIPDYVENRGDPLFHEAGDLLELTRLSDRMLVPLVDTRHLWGDVSTALQGYMARGFKGIKGIYLPDGGNDIGVRGVPDTFGITLQQYHQREWEIFSFAQTHDLPLLYHMDARRYGDVMKAMLEDFPHVRVDFAHLGIGRKAFSAILDRYPNVYTDIAGLLPHMQNNPASYRDFIIHYADRVCFGSDALLYQTESILEYIQMVKNLQLPEDIEAQVFFANPARFLGRALHVNRLDGSASQADVRSAQHELD